MSPDPVTKTCPICWNSFIAAGRNATKHTYCSARCRKAAFERTRKPATPAAPGPPSRQRQHDPRQPPTATAPTAAAPSPLSPYSPPPKQHAPTYPQPHPTE